MFLITYPAGPNDKKTVLQIWAKLTEEDKYIIEMLMRFGENIQVLRPEVPLEIARLFCLRIYRTTKVCRPFLLKCEIKYIMNNIDVILNNGIFADDLSEIALVYDGLKFFENWLDQIRLGYKEHNLAASFHLERLDEADLQEYSRLKSRIHKAPTHIIDESQKRFLFRLVHDFIIELKTNFLSGSVLRNALSVPVAGTCLGLLKNYHFNVLKTHLDLNFFMILYFSHTGPENKKFAREIGEIIE